MLIIGKRIGSKRDPKEYACKIKGNVKLQRVQTRGSREGSFRHRAPEAARGRKDAAGEVHRKEMMKKEGRGAGMQWIKPSCARNKECSVRWPIIWQLDRGGGQLAAIQRKKGRLPALEFGLDAVSCHSISVKSGNRVTC